MRTLKLGLAVLLSFTLFACTEYEPKNISNVSNTPQPAQSVDPLETGRKLYTVSCMTCHKDDGTGGKVVIEGKTIKADNLTDERRKSLSDEKIETVIFNGGEDKGMPAFKDKLSEAQIREVVKYVRTGLQKMPQTPAASPGR